MPFKIVLFFRQFNQGWTETWYLANVSDLLGWARSNFTSSAWVVGWRNPDTVLDSVRVSDLSVKRRAIIFPVPAQAATAPRAAVLSPPTPDVVYTTCLYRIWASGYVPLRHVWLRGLNDDDVVRDSVTGVSIPGGGLKAMADAYIQQWITLGAQIQVLPALPPPGQPQPAVSSAAPAADGVHTNITVANVAPPAAGSQIVVSGFDQRQAPGLQGTFTVLATNGNVVTINYQPTFTGVLTPFNARWRSKVPGYVGIASFEFLRFSQRDTGRPIVPSRGRRRKVSLRS